MTPRQITFRLLLSFGFTSLIYSAAVAAPETAAVAPASPLGIIKVSDPAAAAKNVVSRNVYEPAINCRLPVTSIGTIELGQATAVITDKAIDVFPQPVSYQGAYTQSGQPPALLRGLILRTENSSAAGGDRRLTGLALFLAGTIISQIQESTPDDIIFRNEGAIDGLIVGNGPTYLLLKQKNGSIARIEADTITYVRSPRAFVFNVTGAPITGPNGTIRSAARNITFQSTATTNSVSLSSVVRSQNEFNEDDDFDASLLNAPESIPRIPGIPRPTRPRVPIWP